MFPDRADVVIIGGGIIGASIAYHLARIGITDTVLLERRQLCCGTTWHSVGSVAELRRTRRMTELATYTAELYRSLEAETGQATGYRKTGSIMLGLTHERVMEMQRIVTLARAFGQEAEMISLADVRARCPQVRTDDVLAALYVPSDGRTNPIDTTQALVKGARMRGVKVFENTAVTGLDVAGGRVRGVMTEKGPIKAEIVVLAGGMWSREFAARYGVSLPLQAAEHFYAVTENIEGLQKNMPFVRVPDESVYFKEDAGKLLFGCLEKKAKPWALDGIPEGFCFDSLPEDLDHFEPALNASLGRFPLLQDAGIQLFFNGPEAFTPDGNALVGETPELANLFVACGMNTVGVMTGGSTGKMVAEWIRDRRRPEGYADFDVARIAPFQSGRRYLRDRTEEALGVLYEVGWPNLEYASGRGARRCPLHSAHLAAGAVMGNRAGWEVPLAYAPAGEKPEIAYSYGRQNWVPWVADECRAAETGAALFDLSAHARLEISGAGARPLLDRLSATPLAGGVSHALWLNERGTIEAEVALIQRAQECFLLLSQPGMERRHAQWIAACRRPDETVGVVTLTAAEAVFLLAGPKARGVLEAAGARALSRETAVTIEIGYAPVLAVPDDRLGLEAWLLVMPAEFAGHAFESLLAAGPVVLAGAYALEALRIERGCPAWPSELGDTVTPAMAGLSHRLALDKPEFVGRDAVLAAPAPQTALVRLIMGSDRAALYGQEGILREGELVGLTTSGCWSAREGVPVALGYVSRQGAIDAGYLEGATFELEIPGEVVSATCRIAGSDGSS